MTITIVVDFDLEPSRAGATHRAFRELAEHTRAEPGALVFDAFTDPDRPNSVVLVEQWADQHAIDEHMELPHTKAFLDAVHGAFASPQTVRRLDPL